RDLLRGHAGGVRRYTDRDRRTGVPVDDRHGDSRGLPAADAAAGVRDRGDSDAPVRPRRNTPHPFEFLRAGSNPLPSEGERGPDLTFSYQKRNWALHLLIDHGISGGEEGKMNTGIVSRAAVVVVSVVLGAAAVLGVDQLRDHNTSAPTVINTAVGGRASNVSNNAVQDVADLYANVRPSIVRITGSSSRSGSGGLGSGIVIDNKGFILTNNHVV